MRVAISESSSCLAKSFTNGKSFNSKSFQAESGQGPETYFHMLLFETRRIIAESIMESRMASEQSLTAEFGLNSALPSWS